MTDTDDTDELLLIPPDFFVVESDSGHNYYNIVDKLIKQVDSLQTRLKSIEDSESFVSNSNISMDRDMEPNSRNFRKFNSIDDLQTSVSVQNTPKKPVSKFRLSSLPNTPNIDKFQFSSSPGKRADFRSTRFGDGAFNEYTKYDKEDYTSTDIDTFLSKVKSIQRLTAARNLETEFDSVPKNILKNGKESDLLTKTNWECGDNFGKCTKITPEKDYSDCSSDSTLNASKARNRSDPIHSNALNILDVHKKLLENSDLDLKEVKKERKKKYKSSGSDDYNLNLMNLADIWGGKGEFNQSQLMQKLKEEKYRRQHCEDLIQELQMKNLEFHQKLSVAVKVDESKNNTILKLQDALEKLIARVEKLNKNNIDLEYENNQLKNRQLDDKEEANQKILQYEKEVSKALNLAHSNQEKSTLLEKEVTQLRNQNDILRKKLESCEENYLKECDKYKQISEILAQKEIEINENKNTLTNASHEINESRKAMESCQKELIKIKEDYIQMDEKLKEERSHTVKLNKEITDLLDEAELKKKKEIEFQSEISKLKKQLESNKIDLRNYYQGQVEILVQNKLKEFQSQLDQTETTFKEELKKKEMSIAKSAANHIQSISEKYSLEIKLLEKKHQEELKLYQLQAMQFKQQAESLQNKLMNIQEKRVSVAKQLQKVMEMQWNEAMRIITNGKSPTFQDDSTFATIDQLNSLRTKSYNNLEELLTEDNNKKENAEVLYDKVDMETPVSSKTDNKLKTALSETDLQKYISMFLNRPTAEDLLRELDSDSATKDRGDGSRAKGQRKGLKPPWK